MRQFGLLLHKLSKHYVINEPSDEASTIEKRKCRTDGNVSRAANRLVTMQTLASAPVESRLRLEFLYDYKGRRIEKKMFVWGKDATGSLQGAGGVGGLLLIDDGPSTYRAGFDGNENIVALVKVGDGHLAPSYEYGPFGEPLRTTGEYGEQNPFRFSSVYTDHETGMLSYGFRYYNPQTGSWLGRDALEEAGGLNLSQFVFNNP